MIKMLRALSVAILATCLPMSSWAADGTAICRGILGGPQRGKELQIWTQVQNTEGKPSVTVWARNDGTTGNSAEGLPPVPPPDTKAATSTSYLMRGMGDYWTAYAPVRVGPPQTFFLKGRLDEGEPPPWLTRIGRETG